MTAPMSISLHVRFPKREWYKGKPLRNTYYVVFGSGREMRLTTFCQHLGLNRSTMHKQFAMCQMQTVGIYTEPFQALVLKMKNNLLRTRRRTTIVCPTCRGTGRVQPPTSPPAADAAEIINGN